MVKLLSFDIYIMRLLEYKKRLNIKKLNERVKLEESLLDDFKRVFSDAMRKIKSLGIGFKQEGRETVEMLDTFYNLLANKLNLKNRDTPPSKEEIDAALKQLKEIPSLAPIAIIFLLIPIPAASLGYIYIAGILQNALGDKVKIPFLPDKIRF
jgi:hypothetical protein